MKIVTEDKVLDTEKMSDSEAEVLELMNNLYLACVKYNISIHVAIAHPKELITASYLEKLKDGAPDPNQVLKMIEAMNFYVQKMTNSKARVVVVED